MRGGAKPKTRGNWAEEILTPVFLTLPKCTIVKTEANFKIIGYTRMGVNKVAYGYPEKKGVCDYEGGFHGIHCSIEAKRHQGTDSRWNFKSNIKPHQDARMRRALEFNEIAGVILCWDIETDSGPAPVRWFWIPYGAVVLAVAGGLKSWRLVDLENLATGHEFNVLELVHGWHGKSLESALLVELGQR